MKVPNFDNADLAMIAVTIIELPAIIIGLYKGVDPAALFGFGAVGLTGIISIAKAKPNGKVEEENEGP
jgi:hypothetical protein